MSRKEEGLISWKIPESLQKTIDIVNQGEADTLTLDQQKDWLEYYLFVISDNFTLTPIKLLTDHDLWLKCIQYHSGIDEDKMQQFLDNIPDMKKKTLEEFLAIVVQYFTIDEMKCINFD